MLELALRRLLVSLAVAFSVSVLGFILLRTSGDLAAILAGENASPQEIAEIADLYGLDRPLYVQFFDWFGSALTGDFGRSLFTGESVTELILSRAAPTSILALFSLAVALLVGIPLGVVAALKPNSWVDRGALSLAVAALAVPNFWLGLIAIYVFGVTLRWVPISGAESLQHYILPATVLGLSVMPQYMRLTRTGMIEALNADYVLTARAKGLNSSRIVITHALRNALLPIVSISGITLGFLLSGSVIIEAVFAINGIGRLALDSIINTDFPVVQTIVLILSFAYVLLTFLTDIINAHLDPRIRLQ